MSEDASRLEELARAEYEKFTRETDSGIPSYLPEPPIAPSKAKKRLQLAVLIFLILSTVPFWWRPLSPA